MRVSTSPQDPNYCPDPCNVWVNDRPIPNWMLADDFRRVVLDKEGRVFNGSVRIEVVKAEQPAQEVNAGFAGVLQAAPKEKPPYVQQQVAPKVTYKPHRKRK